jgi:diacylglycerol kinase (ATP)
VFKGTHISHPAVTIKQATTIEVASPGVSAYADGEYLADLPLRCECVAGAVKILA